MSRSLVQLVLLTGLIALPSWVEGKHFRWSSQGDALTLDPHSAAEGFNIAITGLVYERLVERGKDMKLGPVLSESWSNPEPSKWIFKLRRGVKWQDGSAFTAEDVVFSFNRARASTTAYKVIATQAGIPRKIDDFTVEFTTPQPNPAMLETIANIYIMNRGREAHTPQESRLVGDQSGPLRGKRRNHRVPAGTKRFNAHGGIAFGPIRFRPRPAVAGHTVAQSG